MTIELVPELVCPNASHRRFWFSSNGRTWICAACHPPVRPAAAEAWHEVPPRRETAVAAIAAARAERTLHVELPAGVLPAGTT